MYRYGRCYGKDGGIDLYITAYKEELLKKVVPLYILREKVCYIMENSIDKSKQYNLNPRSITDKELNRLEAHLMKFGDLGGVVFCRNNNAYVGGNQRSKIFDGASIEIEKYFDTPQEDKTVAIGFITWNNRKYLYREVFFSEAEFKEACIVANSDGGTWDLDILRDNWLVEDLQEWGLKVDFELEEFKDEIEEKVNPYTRKVESPIYEPSEVCPQLSEVFNTEKTDELINEINSSSIPKNIKDFLLMAAERHTVYKYDKIADYYAHAPIEIKRLMENSALVIPDFNKAIDQGYVTLSEEIREQYLEEYGD